VPAFAAAEFTLDASADELRAGLWDRGVVCLHSDRALDDDELREVAARFGRIKDPVAATRDGELLRYSEEKQIVDAGFVLTDELREQLGDLNFGGLDSQRPGLFETFHTDDSFTPQPSLITVLNARELPSSPGGNTTFLDMRAAYELLPEEERVQLIGLHAVHAYNNHGAFPPRVASEGPFEVLAEVSHPVVRAHPVTGRPALYFDLDRATHVAEMDESDGRKLLQSLQDHAEANAPRYSHSWRAHDVIVWDNSSVQHKAAGDFPLGEPRRFWRYMIEGPVPAAYK
jgi:alpha-ketoglutarate-dependent taurine dioxygenase